MSGHQPSLLGLAVAEATGSPSRVAWFGAPLLVFVNRLMREWTKGVYEYGRLAEQLGFLFEDKWFGKRRDVDARALDSGDFSAAEDLSSYATNVYELRLAPVDWKSFAFLAGATAMPLIPVAFFATPLDVSVKAVASVLL